MFSESLSLGTGENAPERSGERPAYGRRDPEDEGLVDRPARLRLLQSTTDSKSHRARAHTYTHTSVR